MLPSSQVPDTQRWGMGNLEKRSQLPPPAGYMGKLVMEGLGSSCERKKMAFLITLPPAASRNCSCASSLFRLLTPIRKQCFYNCVDP